MTCMVGPGPGDLTALTSAALDVLWQPQAPWKVTPPSSVGPGLNTYTLMASDAGDGTLVAGDSIIVTFASVPINEALGTTTLGVAEKTSSGGGTLSEQVSKFPYGFAFHNLQVKDPAGPDDVAQVAHGGGVRLTWDGSITNPAAYTVLVSTISGQETLRLDPSRVNELDIPALYQDAQFLVQVEANDASGQSVTHALSTSVAVAQPDLAVTSVALGGQDLATQLATMARSLVPTGTIAMWSGAPGGDPRGVGAVRRHQQHAGPASTASSSAPTRRARPAASSPTRPAARPRTPTSPTRRSGSSPTARTRTGCRTAGTATRPAAERGHGRGPRRPGGRRRPDPDGRRAHPSGVGPGDDRVRPGTSRPITRCASSSSRSERNGGAPPAGLAADVEALLGGGAAVRGYTVLTRRVAVVARVALAGGPAPTAIVKHVPAEAYGADAARDVAARDAGGDRGLPVLRAARGRVRAAAGPATARIPRARSCSRTSAPRPSRSWASTRHAGAGRRARGAARGHARAPCGVRRGAPARGRRGRRAADGRYDGATARAPAAGRGRRARRPLGAGAGRDRRRGLRDAARRGRRGGRPRRARGTRASTTTSPTTGSVAPTTGG